MIRFAITRSETRDLQPSAGFPQWRVGSIEAEGILYGFAISAWKTSTPTTARVIVSVQSISVRSGLGNRDSDRSRTRIANQDATPAGPSCGPRFGNVPRPSGAM